MGLTDEELKNLEEEANSDPVYLLNLAALDLDVLRRNINDNKIINPEAVFENIQNNITRAIQLMEPKTIITFGSGQLQWFKGNPLKVMLVINKNQRDARSDVFKTTIGPYFCTSYDYYKYQDEFRKKYNMKEYRLEQVLAGSEDYKEEK